MSAEKEAKKLFGKYYIICQEYTEEIQCSIQAKKCALIAIDEKLETLNRIKFVVDCISLRNHYLQVKKEIQNL
jgi:hypothetical protein